LAVATEEEGMAVVAVMDGESQNAFDKTDLITL